MSFNNTTPVLAEIFSFEFIVKLFFARFLVLAKIVLPIVFPSLIVCFLLKRVLAFFFCGLGVPRRKAEKTSKTIVDIADVCSTLKKK